MEARNWIGKLIIFTMSLVMLVSGSICPSDCRCSLDDRGRKKVACMQGGLRSTIPISKMAEDTQILIVSGTKDNLNYLTLGPIFKKLRSLEEIHIKWSSIPNIGAHSFWGLGEVKVLNLTHNSLSTLMDSNFKGLSSLKQLDLSHNSIESVPSAVFRFIRHLHFLNLSRNKMFSLVTRIFFGLTRLENLDLSHNPLGDLQAELFSDVPALKKLACASCELRNLSDGIFAKLTELKDLDLRNNFLTRVPERLSTLAELVTLRLDGNLISTIDDYTFCDSSLSFLYLSHNKIASVEPRAFVNSSITYLDLSYNKLATLESEGFNILLPHLREFKVNGNPLLGPQLNLLFDRTKQLVHLGLGDVGLTKVPEISRARNLHSLNFSSNFISSIPIDLFASTPHLHELDLSFNQLEEISESVLAKVSDSKSLRVFKLEGNPWRCDQCHIVPLIRWLQESPDQESGCSEPQVWTCVKCATPNVVAHQPLALLPVGDLPRCEQQVTPVPAVLDDSSARRYSFGSQHFASNGSSVDYIDKLNELKIAPSLTDKSMFPVNKLTTNQMNHGSEASNHGLFVTILISVLCFLLMAVFIFMLVFTIRRRRAHQEAPRTWKFFGRKCSEKELGKRNASSSPERAAESARSEAGPKEVRQQMTELKLDKDLSESLLKTSFVSIRETELL